MKQKYLMETNMRVYKRMIAAALMSVLAVVSVEAKERTAPEIEPQTLEVGTNYYMFNIGSGMFMANVGGYAGLSATPGTISFGSYSNYYRLYINGGIFKCTGGEVQSTNSWGGGNEGFFLNETDDVYTIQRNYSYNESEFIGYDGRSSMRVVSTMTGGDIYWCFVTPLSDNIRKCFRYSLYKALVSSDTFDFDVSKYDNLYDEDVCSNSELSSAAKELNARNELAKAILDYEHYYDDASILAPYKAILYNNDNGYDEFFAAMDELNARNELAKLIADNTTTYGNLLNKWKEILYNSSSTEEQLNNARLELERSIQFTNTLTCPSWNDYPMLFTRTSPNWKVNSSNTNQVIIRDNNGDDVSLSWNEIESIGRVYRNTASRWDLPVTVDVDEDAIFAFNFYYSGNDGDPKLTIFLDGVQLQFVDNNTGKTDTRYRINIPEGHHSITLSIERNLNVWTNIYFYLYDFSVMKQGEVVVVDMPEAGELAAELFSRMDDIHQIRKLKVRGSMNSDDWAPIYTMNQLNSLDLSEASITKLEPSQLSASKYSGLANLIRVSLPNSLTEIGASAFSGPPLDSISFSTNLKTIGDYAFARTNLRNVVLPQSVTSIGSYAFENCYFLKKVELPDGASLGGYMFRNCYLLKYVSLPQDLTSLPQFTFNSCTALDSLVIGDNIRSIGQYAFYGCSSLNTVGLLPNLQVIGNYAFQSCSNLKLSLPNTLSSIGQYAFYNCNALDTITIPDGSSVEQYAFRECQGMIVLNIGENCTLKNRAFGECSALDSVVIGENTLLESALFEYCTNLRYIEFPSTYYYCVNSQLYGVNGGMLRTVVFKSPSVVQGSGYTSFFSGVNTDSVTIYVPAFQRTGYMLDSYWYQYPIVGFDADGITDWTINAPVSLSSANRFSGTPDLTINNGGSLKVVGTTAQNLNDLSTHSNGNNRAMVLSNCGSVAIQGSYTHELYTTKNKWNFLTMPFDFRVGDVVSQEGAQMAIRYYDGANRAANGTGNNWKNFTADDIVTAGTGFILMTSKDGVVNFYALDNASKQNVVANHQLAKSLEANPSETTANKGWNFVGNMWLTYFNNHKLNFTAPITVWTGSTYMAYSLIDDDYAIRPLEPFFVQCPDDVDVIAFPTDGRQLTNVIENPNAVKSLNDVASRSRSIINLALLADTISCDKTRIVVNEQASLDYEQTCDAGKFMSMDDATPQLWTIGADGCTPYAINERPLDDGLVALGFTAPRDGQYTISAVRNDAGHITLIDYMNGTTIDLTDSDYTFEAAAGIETARFALQIAGGTATPVETITANSDPDGTVYSLDGRKMGIMRSGLPHGIYLIKRGTNVEKVRY